MLKFLINFWKRIILKIVEILDFYINIIVKILVDVSKIILKIVEIFDIPKEFWVKANFQRIIYNKNILKTLSGNLILRIKKFHDFFNFCRSLVSSNHILLPIKFSPRKDSLFNIVENI